MARREGQKLKLFTLLDIFTQLTDENHPMGVPQLLEQLAERGVAAERKSIYDDIDTLRERGFQIELQRGRGGGYYLVENTFEPAELKMLADAIQASKFITQRKSSALIKKLEQFTSRYHADELTRRVLVPGRVKAQNEGIYAVDTLHAAISRRCQIAFRYRDWTVEGKMADRHPGQYTQVSPWALVWENGNYYLIAYNGQELRHYRVDKIYRPELREDTPCEGRAEYERFNVNEYVQKTFNMFRGPECRVQLRCENRLAGAIIDRFGTEPIRLPREDGKFDITVTLQKSDQFYGWVLGFGGSVEIIAPADMRREFAEKLEKLRKMHE